MISLLSILVRAIGASRGARWNVRSPDGTLNAPPIITGQAHGEVLWVLDGDTVDVRIEDRAIRIRLYSIDCPEDGQPWGEIAKAGLIKLIGRKSVVLEVHGIDQYGRTLATVFVKHGLESKLINVNERMVMLGHAWVMRWGCDQLPKERRTQLDRLEAWAKSKQVGLWRMRSPSPPWQWRRGTQNADRVHPPDQPS